MRSKSVVTYYSKLYVGLHYLFNSAKNNRTSMKWSIGYIIGVLQILNYLPIIVITLFLLDEKYFINKYLVTATLVTFIYFFNSYLMKKSRSQSYTEMRKILCHPGHRPKLVRFTIFAIIFSIILFPVISIVLAVFLT